MSPELRERLIEAFSRPVIPDLVQKVHIALRQRILERYPHAQGSVPEAMVYLPGYEGVCSGTSGNRWRITFDAEGRHVPDTRLADRPSDTTGYRRWEVAVSGRVPILTVIERECQPDHWTHPLDPPDAKLVVWAIELCAEFGLEYVDAVELLSWQVSDDILTEDMIVRMDDTDHPNAFQLLFYEY